MTERTNALESVLTRAEAAGWAGADPYDGLLSSVGRFVIPFGSLPRLGVSQGVLRSRVLRSVVRPHPSVNAKGLALFLGAATRSRAILGDYRARALAGSLIGALKQRAMDHGGALGWGYPFPWQSRYFFAPIGTPNAVVTSTVAWQLLEAADAFGDAEARTLATRAAKFLTDGLNWSDAGGGALAVSYTPRDRSMVINVSGLVARVLARLGDTNRATRLLQFIERSQDDAGGWAYSRESHGRWEDSFHTGFLLESLLDLRSWGLPVSERVLRSGFASYRRFFDEDGGARLYPSSQSLYDAHSAAQGMVTYAAAARAVNGESLAQTNPEVAANRISGWSLRRLWISEKGSFAYRCTPKGRDEIDYSRWVQAWMAFGLATVMALERRESGEPMVEQSA